MQTAPHLTNRDVWHCQAQCGDHPWIGLENMDVCLSIYSFFILYVWVNCQDHCNPGSVWDRIFGLRVPLADLAGECWACYPSNPASSRCLEGNGVRDLVSVPPVLPGVMTELSWDGREREMEGNGRNAMAGSRTTELPWHKHLLPRLARWQPCPLASKWAEFSEGGRGAVLAGSRISSLRMWALTPLPGELC